MSCYRLVPSRGLTRGLLPALSSLRAQGRPKDGPEDKFRLRPVQARLAELLGKEVRAIEGGNIQI